MYDTLLFQEMSNESIEKNLVSALVMVRIDYFIDREMSKKAEHTRRESLLVDLTEGFRRETKALG